MKILMIGGTTFFGKDIVENLLAQGHRVCLYTRGRRRPDFFNQVERLEGDRAQSRVFREQVRGKSFDAVIDNIAFSAEAVKNALDALGGRIGRYVLTSTASVMGLSARGAGEDWGYEWGKWEAERVLLEQTRVPYTIIRPPVVLGPDDPDLRGYFYFQRILDGKPLILTDGGRRPFPLVYSRDLARAYGLALGSRRAENRTYFIAQKKSVTVAELVKAAGRGLGLKPRVAAMTRQALEKIGFEYPEPYARESGPGLDTAKAEKELGFSSTEFSQWIAETALWYRDRYKGPDSVGYAHRNRETEVAAPSL